MRGNRPLVACATWPAFLGGGTSTRRQEACSSSLARCRAHISHIHLACRMTALGQHPAALSPRGRGYLIDKGDDEAAGE